jgi:NADH-quinone oxidoreductase subunit N
MPHMPFTWSSLAPAVAEIYLALAVCVILMVDVFSGERRRGFIATLTLLALVVGTALLIVFGRVSGRTTLFDGMFVADPLSFVLKLAGYLFLAVTLLYSRSYLNERGLLRGEYYVLTMTALLGIFVVISANSLLTVYIGIELLALSVYAIIAFDRDNPIAAESAVKYFVLSAIASGVLLYGMSMIYGLTGHSAFTLRRARASYSGSCSSWSPWLSSSGRYRSTCGCRTCITAHRPP